MNKTKVRELTEDYIFKRVFGKKGNEDILKDLLESILEIKIAQIEVIIGTEIEKEKIEDKLGIIDLKATINKETTVDIEIQVKNYHNMIERSTFYIAGLYHTGLKRGEAYEGNNKVIGINILMFNVFEWKKIHSKGVLKESELNEVMTDKLELHFLELPKLIENKEEGNKRLRQWLEFIYNKRKGEIEMAVKENEKIAKANQEWEYLRGDEAEKRLAFLKEKWERDWNSNMHYAEETGMKKGMKKGMKEGRKEVAIKMLQEKIDEEIISKVTNLSLEEIKNLKNEIKYEVKKEEK